MSEKLLEFAKIRETVDIDKVLPCKIFTSAPKEIQKCALAKALQDTIVVSETGVILRDIIPQIDLLSANGLNAATGEWIWPNERGYYFNDIDQWIYKGSVNAGRTMIVYGVRILQYPIHITHVYFYDCGKREKRMQPLEIQTQSYNEIGLGPKRDFYLEGGIGAISYAALQRNEKGEITEDKQLGIQVHTSTNASGKQDRIKILGVVAEPIGQNFTG